MLTDERKAHLLRLLAATGRIVARDVSVALNLSEDTIRRDLRDLARAGLLKRVHGGAVPVSAALADVPGRGAISGPEKARIGAVAAAMIAPGQVVFVDGGTTALCLARAIAPGLCATVITHAPQIALALGDHAGLTVELVGGRLFRHSQVATGAATLAALDRFRPDLCFIGVTGAEATAGLTTGDSEEAEIKRAVIARAGEAVILASPEKIGAVSSFKLADWGDVGRLVVAAPPDVAFLRTIAQAGCDLVQA